jgi:cytidylate kinase
MRSGSSAYIPGQYRPDGKRDLSEESGHFARMLQARRPQTQRFATIHFSRKIGSGALEIAHLLAPRIGYTVIDRQILEHIARDAQLGDPAAAYFDERYPGRLSELASMFFKGPPIRWDDYFRHLFGAVLALAELGPTIFVGRGAHLIMPRHWVLSIRIIASENTRVQRLMRELNLNEKTARSVLRKMDSEQHQFFRRAFGKHQADPSEFDMVINCDYITNPSCAASIIEQAFRKKYAALLTGPIKR